MRLRRSDVCLLVGLVSLFGLSTTAFAQRTSGDITGTVTDGTGGVLPGVAVTAVCTETSFTRSAVTDTQGGSACPELPLCLYKVTATSPDSRP